VKVHTSRNTVQITDGARARHRMVFDDGSWLETDMIVFSAGIRPRDELARQSALAVGPRGGIAVDDHCRTSDRDIYAIGECAAWNETIFGLVAPGYEMARVAARHIAGDADATFRGADMSTKLKLMGVDVASIGDAHGKTPGSLNYHYVDERKRIYKKIVVSGDGKQLLGAVLVGHADEYGTLLQTVLNGIALPPDPEFLILPTSDGQAQAGTRRRGPARHRADLFVQQRQQGAASARPSVKARSPPSATSRPAPRLAPPAAAACRWSPR
jgi:nitrite reductase (NADH) large subunit